MLWQVGATARRVRTRFFHADVSVTAGEAHACTRRPEPQTYAASWRRCAVGGHQGLAAQARRSCEKSPRPECQGYGRGAGIRTQDLLNPIQVRYQAALRPASVKDSTHRCAGRPAARAKTPVPATWPPGRARALLLYSMQSILGRLHRSSRPFRVSRTAGKTTLRDMLGQASEFRQHVAETVGRL